MRDFISRIRRIGTADLIATFSKISIEMFKSGQYYQEFDVPVYKGMIRASAKVTLPAWDIQTIEYLSVKNSNDYRRSDKPVTVGEIVALYRNYDNKHSVADVFSDSDEDDVFRAIMGMTAEQFMFQNQSWIFEKFNRDYYILIGATDYEHRLETDVDDVIRQVFGYSAKDYVTILLTVFMLCTYHPSPMKVLKEINLPENNSLLTRDNIEKFIEYYSCSYEELRKSGLGKQLLYSKPFIKTQEQGAYLTSNMYLVTMTLANGLYWLVRDYYYKTGTQQFPNSFGLLFEDYIKELAKTYCKEQEWEVVPPRDTKEADFIFKFPSLHMIIETKTSLLQLNAKQQVPNMESMKSFFDRTIRESYDQLQGTYNRIRDQARLPMIKVILLYDEFSNTSIIEHAITDIFAEDSLCYIMTIREFEIILYLHCYDLQLSNQICKSIVEQMNVKGREKITIGAILEKLSIFKNPHLAGEMDSFSRLYQDFKQQFAGSREKRGEYNE